MSAHTKQKRKHQMDYGISHLSAYMLLKVVNPNTFLFFAFFSLCLSLTVSSWLRNVNLTWWVSNWNCKQQTATHIEDYIYQWKHILSLLVINQARLNIVVCMLEEKAANEPILVAVSGVLCASFSVINCFILTKQNWGRHMLLLILVLNILKLVLSLLLNQPNFLQTF